MTVRIPFLILTVACLPISKIGAGICLVAYLAIGIYQLRHDL